MFVKPIYAKEPQPQNNKKYSDEEYLKDLKKTLLKQHFLYTFDTFIPLLIVGAVFNGLDYLHLGIERFPLLGLVFLLSAAYACWRIFKSTIVDIFSLLVSALANIESEKTIKMLDRVDNWSGSKGIIISSAQLSQGIVLKDYKARYIRKQK